MPAPADPVFVFNRIRTEINRLMYLNTMKSTTIKFHEVLDTMEPRYAEARNSYIADLVVAYASPRATVAPRETKETRAQARERSLREHADQGRAAFHAGTPYQDNPFPPSEEHNRWRDGWQHAFHLSTKATPAPMPTATPPEPERDILALPWAELTEAEQKARSRLEDIERARMDGWTEEEINSHFNSGNKE